MVKTTASLAITFSSTLVSPGLKYQRLPVLATAYVSPVTTGTKPLLLVPVTKLTSQDM